MTFEAAKRHAMPHADDSLVDQLHQALSAHPDAELLAIVHLSTVAEHVERFKAAFPRVRPFYAVKSCPDPRIMETVDRLGGGFDCASRGELRAVTEMGVSPDSIIYANTNKHCSMIGYARDIGVKRMTFDSLAELDKIHAIHPGADLVLRLNIGNVEESSLLSFGTKFGINSVDEARTLVEHASQLGLNIIGTAFHVGSGCRSVENFHRALSRSRAIWDVMEESGFRPHFLDIGGGWPETPAEVEEFAERINPLLDLFFPEDGRIKVIAEPGRYLCARSTTLAVQVINCRHRKHDGLEKIIACPMNISPLTLYGDGSRTDTVPIDQEIFVSDGVYGCFQAAFFDAAVPWKAFELVRSGRLIERLPELAAMVPYSLQRHNDADDDEMVETQIYGMSCDPIDTLCYRMHTPRIFLGDWIAAPYFGAYTLAGRTPFNGFTDTLTKIYVE